MSNYKVLCQGGDQLPLFWEAEMILYIRYHNVNGSIYVNDNEFVLIEN